MTTDHERTLSISATDMAAIVYRDPWKWPQEVYMHKVGTLPPREQNWLMTMGIEAEEFAGSQYARRNEVEIYKPDPEKIYHAGIRHISASPDFLIVDKPGYVEIKTTSENNKSNWDKGVPLHIRFQVLFTLAVLNSHKGMNIEYCDVYTWFGLSSNETYRIVYDERNRIIGETMIRTADEFWKKYVLTTTMPEIDPTGETICDNLFKKMYPDNTEDHLQSTIETEDMLDVYLERQAALKQADTDFNQSRNGFKKVIGTASGITYPDGSRLDYKTNKAGNRILRYWPVKGE